MLYSTALILVSTQFYFITEDIHCHYFAPRNCGTPIHKLSWSGICVTRKRVQELKSALSQAEVEKNTLRETMVQTEALIKQARHEHDQEITEATEAAAAEREVLQRKCNDLQASVCDITKHTFRNSF